MEQEFASVEIIEFGKKDLKGYTLLLGFPGMGLVGTIVAKYLMEKISFKKFGYIKSNIFVPILRVREGKPIYPSRLFIDEKSKIVLIQSEQIIPSKFKDDFARAIADWVKKKKISKVVSGNGIRTMDMGDKRKVYYVTTNDRTKKFLEKAGAESIKEGIVSGLDSLVLLELKETNIDAYSLLGEINQKADYDAAVAVLKVINNISNLKISIKPLEKEAETAKKELTQFLENLKKTHSEVEKLESQTPTTT